MQGGQAATSVLTSFPTINNKNVTVMITLVVTAILMCVLIGGNKSINSEIIQVSLKHF
jgi:hypothetical protein